MWKVDILSITALELKLVSKNHVCEIVITLVSWIKTFIFKRGVIIKMKPIKIIL